MSPVKRFEEDLRQTIDELKDRVQELSDAENKTS
jgi:hypothetical protein